MAAIHSDPRLYRILSPFHGGRTVTGTLARHLATGLAGYGVDRVFAIPGVHNSELFRGLAEAGIRVVLPRHEQSAGFMADGFARASGQPGVCVVVSGPGLTNVLTALGEAHSDSVPILVISTVLSRRDVGKGRGKSHDMLDQAGAVRSFGALSFTIEDAAEVGELLARSFTMFWAQRPRPVHLQLAFDRLATPDPALLSFPAIPSRPVPPDGALQSAAALIEQAWRPVVIAGGGAADCSQAMERFLNRSGGVFASTVAGKGVVDERHPLALGCALPRRAIRDFLRGCDLTIVVGSELSRTDFGPDGPLFAGPVIRIDVDPQALVTNCCADAALLGDAGATLDALVERISAQDPKFSADEVADARLAAHREAHDERPGMKDLLASLRHVLPADTIIAADMTEMAYLANEVFPVSQPRSWLHPMGFGTLGYALPAGIGAKLACGERPVAVMIGDYGLQYTLAEIGTARELELPIPVLVWNNEKLHAIEKDMIRRQMEPIAVEPMNPDFVQLANSFRARAARPESLDELEAAVAEALRAKGPTLIDLKPHFFSS